MPLIKPRTYSKLWHDRLEHTIIVQHIMKLLKLRVYSKS
jgi:hypothetical protein